MPSSTTKEDINEQELLRLLRKKDRNAIHQLYVTHSPVFLAICMRYVKDREAAKDIMHEGFMKILNVLDSYKGNGSFEGWMKRIIVNFALDALKKQKKRFLHNIDDVNEPLEELEEEHEIDLADVNQDKPEIGFVRNASLTSKEIMEEVNTLPDLYRIIFVLFVIDGFTHAMIAEELNIDEKASRTRLNRARKMVKQRLYAKSITRLAK